MKLISKLSIIFLLIAFSVNSQVLQKKQEGVASINNNDDKIIPRKSNPGNYIAFNKRSTKLEIANALKLPGVKGVQIRYKWAVLEPTKGEYDFSSIQFDLDLATKNGKQLVVFFLDKNFIKENDVLPPYLSDYTSKWGPSRRGAYGNTAVRWDPYVIERMKLILNEIAKRFDKHPNFEGIAIQETALGAPWKPKSLEDYGYTPEIYRDALIQMLTNASKSFKESSVFWYINFLPVKKQIYLRDVALTVAPLGALRVGGPDVLPDGVALKSRTYPLYDDLVGKLPLFCAIQNDSYSHLHKDKEHYKTKYWTLQELVDFSKNRLHVNYLFWNHKKKSSHADSYNFNDAIPVIENNTEYNIQLLDNLQIRKL